MYCVVCTPTSSKYFLNKYLRICVQQTMLYLYTVVNIFNKKVYYTTYVYIYLHVCILPLFNNKDLIWIEAIILTCCARYRCIMRSFYTISILRFFFCTMSFSVFILFLFCLFNSMCLYWHGVEKTNRS